MSISATGALRQLRVSRSGFNQTRFALGVRRSNTNLAVIRIESVSTNCKPDRTGANIARNLEEPNKKNRMNK